MHYLHDSGCQKLSISVTKPLALQKKRCVNDMSTEDVTCVGQLHVNRAALTTLRRIILGARQAFRC